MANTVVIDPDEGLNIEVSSGVNAKLQPFCGIWINGKQVGQLDPDEVRAFAMQWLTAAEAAEHDSIVFAELVETVGMDKDAAMMFVASLRNRRKS